MGALRQSPVPPYMGQQSGGALGAQREAGQPHNSEVFQNFSVVFRVRNPTIRKYIGIRLDADQEVRWQPNVWE